MTPTAYRDHKIMLAGEANAKDDLGSTRAARDDRRTTIYPRVMNSAGSIVAWLARAEGLTSKSFPEILCGGFRKHNNLLRDAGRRERTPATKVTRNQTIPSDPAESPQEKLNFRWSKMFATHAGSSH